MESDSQNSAVQYPSPVDTFRSMLRTTLRLKRRLRPLFAERGLTGAQFGTLRRIPDHGISLTELASMSSTDPPTVSGIVDRLVKAGLIRRERSQVDRRVVEITLTDQGRATLNEVVPLHRQTVSEALSPLSPSELSTLTDLLGKVERHLAADADD